MILFLLLSNRYIPRPHHFFAARGYPNPTFNRRRNFAAAMPDISQYANQAWDFARPYVFQYGRALATNYIRNQLNGIQRRRIDY